MTNHNKPCPNCRKRRIKVGKCAFCGWISEDQKELEKELLTKRKEDRQ